MQLARKRADDAVRLQFGMQMFYAFSYADAPISLSVFRKSLVEVFLNNYRTGIR